MPSGVCTHCGCSEIDKDPARGDAVCTGCGSVLEDQIIVSEIQFQENSGGGNSMIGQFVSNEGQKGHSFGPGFHHGFGKESRAITLQNGKKQIQMVGAQLKLNNHCIETAFNFYKMAVARRITRGRKNAHVIAACLYIVCRTEGTSHMLLDFSDVLQVNVYTLGRTYLALSKELCINIPALDPCIYIQRFAHRLEFGDKTHDVSMTAMRLVQRMKRDWIHAGRRPSGLCGAALIVAARWHNFGRSVRDLIKIAKISEATMRKRLMEFEETPSSQLTMDEFQRIDLEEEHDPPCYLAGKRRAKVLAQLEEAGELNQISAEIAEVQEQIEKALEMPLRKGKQKITATESDQEKDKEEQDEAEKFLQEEVYKASMNDDDEESSLSKPLQDDPASALKYLPDLSNSDSCDRDIVVEKLEKEELEQFRGIDPSLGICHTPGPRPTPASLGLKETIEECMAVRNQVIEDTGDGELDLTGIDDEEIDRLYILSRTEVVIKARMWIIANSDYLKEQREKRQKEKEEEESGIKTEKKKKKPRRKQLPILANSAGEAIEKIVQEKKISSKINYDVLKSLNTSDITPSASAPLADGPVIIESGPVMSKSLERRFKRSAPAVDVNEPLSKILKRERVSPAKASNNVGPSFTATTRPAVVESGSVAVEPVIVESGPVMESGPIEYDDDEEEVVSDDEFMSASKLMGQENYHDEYGYDDDGDDDD